MVYFVRSRKQHGYPELFVILWGEIKKKHVFTFVLKITNTAMTQILKVVSKDF